MPDEHHLNATKDQLFLAGVTTCRIFLLHNKLPLPQFFTYEEIFQHPESNHYRLLRKLEHGPAQGYATGYYTQNTIFVNLKKAARLQKQPVAQLWSFPAYKIDRTPYGVVAHETGHHVDHCLHDIFRRNEWIDLYQHTKRITSYEPRPWEAGAESMRLFILNPDLLKKASLARYSYIERQGLEPVESRHFADVLYNHPAYVAQAEKWIAQR